MSTGDINEGDASGANLPETGSSGKLYIQMLQRGGDDMTSDMHWALNLFLCFIALCILYGYYIAFGMCWLTAMTNLGEDLNWAFFGACVSVFGGMGAGVAYSMKSQQIGWWEPLSPGDARKDRDPRGKCCGFQIY
eukprot:UN01520